MVALRRCEQLLFLLFLTRQAPLFLIFNAATVIVPFKL
tara:strand:- start:1094 stop:1207 length:114 start_codon:yes stop_codon:yes gene_type:complete